MKRGNARSLYSWNCTTSSAATCQRQNNSSLRSADPRHVGLSLGALTMQNLHLSILEKNSRCSCGLKHSAGPQSLLYTSSTVFGKGGVRPRVAEMQQRGHSQMIFDSFNTSRQCASFLMWIWKSTCFFAIVTPQSSPAE